VNESEETQNIIPKEKGLARVSSRQQCEVQEGKVGGRVLNI